MSAEPEPNFHVTGLPQPTLHASPDAGSSEADDAATALLRARKLRRLMWVRLLLLLLSTAGVIAACALWADGLGGLGLRLVAADVLTILMIVLLL